MNRTTSCANLIGILSMFYLFFIVARAEPIPECKFLYKLTSPEPQSYGYFGSSCIMLNKSIVIGEPGLYSRTPKIGTVHFFNYNGNLTQSLKSPIDGDRSYFGYALTTCDKLLLIGDPGISVNGIESAGMVHVYTLEGEYIQSITSIQPSLNGEFGRSLASNGNVILIGEPGPQILDENVTSRVHVYDNKVEYKFTIQQSEARAGCFGMSIAVNNETIIISEPYFSEKRAGWQGIVYLYDMDGGLIRNITSPFHATTYIPRNFGYRVSANDNLIAIGEVRGNVDELEAAGRAYIYNKNGVLLTNLTSLKPYSNVGFGYLRVWRNLVLVGDYIRVENFTERLGAVIYDRYEDIRAIVSSRDYEWVRGSPIAFNDDYVVLGDISGTSSGVQYAGNVYVMSVPQEIWELDEEIENNNGIPILVLVLVTFGVLVLLFRRHGHRILNLHIP